jgi:hypothetical protein
MCKKRDEEKSAFDVVKIANVIAKFSREHEFDFEVPSNMLAERILLASRKPVNFYDIAKFCFDVMWRHQKEGCNADINYIVNRQLDIFASPQK